MKLSDYNANTESYDDVLSALLGLISEGCRPQTKDKLYHSIKAGNYKTMKNVENFSVEFIPAIPELKLCAMTEVTFKAKSDFKKELAEVRKSLISKI